MAIKGNNLPQLSKGEHITVIFEYLNGTRIECRTKADLSTDLQLNFHVDDGMILEERRGSYKVTTPDAIAKIHQLNEVLKIEGMFITKLSDRGSENVVEHPATKLYKQYNAIYKQYLAELGLSPSSRAKLGVLNQQAREEEQDPLLKILSE